MCKHILNAQVAVRAPCCQKFFDCPQCHAEVSDHALRKTTEMAFICKKCRRAFRKDLGTFEEADEYCPHCDNCYVIEAKTAKPAIGLESEDARVDNSVYEALDPRMKFNPNKDFHTRDYREKEEGSKVDHGGLAGAMQALSQKGATEQEARRRLEEMGADLSSLDDFSNIDQDLDWS